MADPSVWLSSLCFSHGGGAINYNEKYRATSWMVMPSVDRVVGCRVCSAVGPLGGHTEEKVDLRNWSRGAQRVCNSTSQQHWSAASHRKTRRYLPMPLLASRPLHFPFPTAHPDSFRTHERPCFWTFLLHEAVHDCGGPYMLPLQFPLSFHVVIEFVFLCVCLPFLGGCEPLGGRDSLRNLWHSGNNLLSASRRVQINFSWKEGGRLKWWSCVTMW